VRPFLCESESMNLGLDRHVDRCCLIRGFVIAGGAAGFAVHEAVQTDADVECGLAEATVLIALTLTFGHFALGATGFGLAGSSGHVNNVSAAGRDGECAVGNVPLAENTPPTKNC